MSGPDSDRFYCPHPGAGPHIPATPPMTRGPAHGRPASPAPRHRLSPGQDTAVLFSRPGRRARRVAAPGQSRRRGAERPLAPDRRRPTPLAPPCLQAATAALRSYGGSRCTLGPRQMCGAAARSVATARSSSSAQSAARTCAPASTMSAAPPARARRGRPPSGSGRCAAPCSLPRTLPDPRPWPAPRARPLPRSLFPPATPCLAPFPFPAANVDDDGEPGSGCDRGHHCWHH